MSTFTIKNVTKFAATDLKKTYQVSSFTIFRFNQDLQEKTEVYGTPTIAALIPLSVQQGRREPGIATQQKIGNVFKLKLKNEMMRSVKYLISKQIELIKSLKV